MCRCQRRRSPAGATAQVEVGQKNKVGSAYQGQRRPVAARVQSNATAPPTLCVPGNTSPSTYLRPGPPRVCPSPGRAEVLVPWEMLSRVRQRPLRSDSISSRSERHQHPLQVHFNVGRGNCRPRHMRLGVDVARIEGLTTSLDRTGAVNLPLHRCADSQGIAYPVYSVQSREHGRAVP